MYKNLVSLDQKNHKSLKLNPLKDLLFAKKETFIPVVANEIDLVAMHFPVVFTADKNASLISLVSLGGDNLGINENGKWISNYLPSFFKKYPFFLAATKEDSKKKIILIDEDSALFSKSKGKQLFKKNGEQSEMLKNTINFLTIHENQMITTNNISNIIANSGILDDGEISLGEGDEKKVYVNGFKIVNRKKLNALSDAILADWTRKGIITLIDIHLKSLKNIQTMFSLAHQRGN